MKLIIFLMVLIILPSIYATKVCTDEWCIESEILPSMQTNTILSSIDPISGKKTYIYDGYLYIHPIEVTEQTTGDDDTIILQMDKPIGNLTIEPKITKLIENKNYRLILILGSSIIIFMSLTLFIILIGEKNRKV